MKNKKKKHSVLGIRKTSKTQRARLGTQVITDRKKEASKKACRGKANYE